MAMTVYRIELAEGVPDIRISNGHSGLMALVTLRGTPLGDIRVKAHCRTISSRYLTKQIVERFGIRILQLWFEERMNHVNRPPAPSSLPSIDVIVCTSDRPADLRKCLQSLSHTLYPRKSFIVVDNGVQNEATRNVVLRYAARYVREEKRGLDFARNAGLRASDAELVAFADDDVVVDPMWLDRIVEAFQEEEAVACVTGLTMPMELETEAQELFESYSDGGMRRGYERQVFNAFNMKPAAAGKAGVGANMAFRSAVLKRIGGFDEALDCGTPARAGGDTDMFYRILQHGYKISHEPRVLAWHRHRRGMDELRGQLAGYSTAVFAFLTKCALDYRDLNAVSVGYSWFKSHHLRNLVLGMAGRGPQPWSMTLAEVGGALRGPLAYLRAKSYVSQVRLREGSERRGRLNHRDNVTVGNGDFARCASAILARLTASRRGRKSA